MCTSCIVVTYYVNHENRTRIRALLPIYTRPHMSIASYCQPCSLFAPNSYFFSIISRYVYTYTHTHRWMCAKERRKKTPRFFFCSKRLLMRWKKKKRRKNVHAFGRETTTIMWQNEAKKGRESARARTSEREGEGEKSLVLVAIGIKCMIGWFVLALMHILCPFLPRHLFIDLEAERFQRYRRRK